MQKRPRLLIIGLDGASPNIMASLMESGLLPNFAAIAKDSLVSTLRCTWPPHTATGWSSLIAGRLPGQHGIFQFWDCQDPSYRLRVTPRTAIGGDVIWDLLSQRGWTLGLFNIPMSHPPAGWKTYQLTWPLESTLHYCHPRELLHEISSIGGLSLPDIACMYNGSEDYPEKAIQFIKARTFTMQYLLSNYPTDAVMVVYPEIDRVSHHFWPSDPSLPGEDDQGKENAIVRIYKELDNSLSKLLEMVDDDCVVMIVSDHGFGPGARGYRIHKDLIDEGFLTLDRSTGQDPAEAHYSETQPVDAYLKNIDWEKTKLYMPTPGSFGLNLNLKGRQIKGCVSEKDRDKITRDVIDFFSEIKDPITNDLLFQAIVPSEIAYAGPFSSKAPDILLVPNDARIMILPEISDKAWGKAGQTGLHRLEGVFMLRAPSLPTKTINGSVGIETVCSLILDTLKIDRTGFAFVGYNQSAELALKNAGIPPAAWSIKHDRPLNLGSFTYEEDNRKESMPLNNQESVVISDQDILNRLREMGYM